MKKRKKVILDTDIGNDIDDSFALGLLLTLENVDIKLISTCFQDTEYRARVVAKTLTNLSRTDIPIAIGYNNLQEAGSSLQRYVEDFSWDDYSGEVYQDGIEAIVDCIKQSEEKITIISIGAATNLVKVLERYPEAQYKSEIIGMYGSVRKGYIGSDKPCPEANVYVDLDSFEKLMQSEWEITMVPLDACREFIIDGDNYQKMKHSKNPLCRTVLEQYEIWQTDYSGGARKFDVEESTSILFDIPPVLYLYNQDWFEKEELYIKVTKDKMTVEDEDGRMCTVLTDIQSDGELETFVVDRFLSYLSSTREEMKVS
ncbi:MAG: nucleoside hydrolase [Tyzzerella sp.]|nr:nucleoside hydrolase [Tyzzerella sp.]